MLYYSEVLDKKFKSEEECVQAEAKYAEEQKAAKEKAEALSRERKDRAKEVEDAYAAAITAQKEYRKLLNQFVKDFGSFHMTFSTDNFWRDFFSF